MKKALTTTFAVLFMLSSISAQYYKTITVPAGTKVIEKFPYSERYLYPQFTEGQVFMKTGATNESKLNYNLLLGEVEFIQNSDTLVISRKSELILCVVEQDTFLYKNIGYLKLIHSGTVKVCLRDKIKLKDIVKKGAMGAPNRTSSVENFKSLPLGGKIYDIIPADDMEFQRTLEFFILTSSGDLIDIKKKNVLELYPQKENEIKEFLKTNKIKFDMQDDILKLADFLATF